MVLLYFIGGSKGCGGKTFAQNNDVEVLYLSLDNADGWIELVKSCGGSNRDFIVKSAACSAVSFFFGRQ